MSGEIVIHATVRCVTCPVCEAELEGFASDPRGKNEIECEQCDTKFEIPCDARVILD
jgi:hypothetical protein